MELSTLLIVCIFSLGYLAIIFEHILKVNKTAVAIFIAIACWMVYFLYGNLDHAQDLEVLGRHVSDTSQIIFFLLGAMTLVELIDSHRGFKFVTDVIRTTSKRKMLWLISIVTFFLSSVLDNLTTTILMVSLLKKLIPDPKERLVLGCAVIVAANAGGAWTPIGDVTTTMLWINGQLSSWSVMKALFVPSILSALVPIAWFSWKMKGHFPLKKEADGHKTEPGAKLVFILGVSALIFVPIFKAWTGLPPFMGILIALALLWLVTDLLHHKHETRQHLLVPHILTRIDTSGVLFFLGILLCVGALDTAGILHHVALWLDKAVHAQYLIATFIGLISAVIDNVPLVAATMGMYPLQQYPMDASLWHMIAYAAGTGGSILIIGSSSGVALMGMEKIDFITYLKKAAFPVLIGYLIGMGYYVLMS